MASEDVVRSLQGLQRRPPAGATPPPFVDTITGPTQQPDGTDLYTTGLVAPPGNDLSIPIGSWTLRLVPVGAGGTARVAVRMFFPGGSDDFDRIEVDLARFELISDPRDLVPADLVADPYVHLVPNLALGTVRLLGPGLTLVLAGAGLTDVSARFTGANGGADPRFPSARFVPPHFLVAGTDVGIACDEVMLDLNGDIDPANLDDLTGVASDGTFTGVILQELGIFVGDPNEVGTWSGMARVHGFVMRFDPMEITGTFEGELVHAVAPDDPQVAIVVSFLTDSGQRVDAAEVDPTVPAPKAPEVARKVRLVATPNWASVGFQVKWTLPEGVELENPERVNQPDLGWLRLPPGAHTFTVDVTDHRVDPVSAHRTVLVQHPPQTPTTAGLKVDLVATVVEPAGGSQAIRLFAPLVPRQPVLLTLDARGGTGNTLTAGCAVPAGWQVAEPQDQTANRIPDGSFQRLTWTLTTGLTPSEGAVSVTAVLGTETVERRLRYTLRPETPDGTPELDLIALTDWRPEPGVAAAKAVAHDGLAYDTPEYRLGSVPAPADILAADARDELFAETSPAFANEAAVSLANTGGLIEPHLTDAGRLYRLVADIPSVPPVQPPSLVVFPEDAPTGGGGTRPSAQSDPLTDEHVTPLFPEGHKEFYRPGGVPAGPIRFAWDRPDVPVRADLFQPAHEDDGATAASLTAEQAQGFADLFRAIDEVGDRIARLGLFASASTEGSVQHNLDLSNARLASARDQLENPGAELRAAIAALPPEHRVDGALIDRASQRVRDLPESKRTTAAWGEENPISNTNPFDRRVFGVIEIAPPAATTPFQRRTYFLVAAGAEITPTPPPRLPAPEQHPFRHSVFRSAHVELELRRNDLLRFQIRLELDLERFDENDLDPPGELNPSDGIMTGFLELRRNPDPAANPRYSWELDLLSDPNDADGLLASVKGGTLSPLVEALGGPLIAMPAMAAAAGGRAGPSSLLVALGVGTFLQQAGVFDVQVVVWRGLRLRLQHGGVRATRFSFALDYSVKYDIDVDLTPMGIPLRMETTTPIEVGFRNVGVEVAGRFDGITLFYDPASGFAVDIGDPGTFLLGDGLGRLLRVDRISSGAGSPLWLEVELAFALDTGVFSVDALRVRLSLEGDTVLEPDENGVVHLDETALDLDDLRLQVNKLGVSVDVPGVLEGSGVLGIKEAGGGTTVEGGLSLDFDALPVLRGLDGELRLFTSADLRAIYLALGIDFSPGLALGSTGVAAYGLHGLLGSNMAPSRPEPLEWLRQPPVGVTSSSKWVAARGSWAFGAGATLGTVFDGGFSLNLNGTLLLLLPGPRLVLAAHANVLSDRPEIGEAAGVLATAMLDLENDLITAGFDLAVHIKGLLDLRVPTEAFFDLQDASNFYVRFGQWVPESKRITLRIFELFDAWGYLQIEGRGVHNGALDLDGISIAAGARIEITWGKKHVLYLEAFAEAHAGIQLAPLYFEGLVRVGGSIHVGPFSIGASGELVAKVRVTAPRFLVLQGKVCGEIDLWLTTLRKCASFELGDGDQPTPRPENPFTEAVAVDRLTGLPIAATDGGDVLVPIDAVFHATFTSDIRDDRTPPGISFADPSIYRNQASDALFYEFGLTALAVHRVGDGDVAGVTSAWAPYTLVEADSAPPSQRTLRILDWKPTAHPRQVDFGSATESALAVLIASLCDPVVPPPRVCAEFDEEPLGHRSIWVLDQRPLRPVRVVGPSASLGAEAAAGEGEALPPSVVPLVAVDYPARRPQLHCLHLGRPRKGRPLHELLDLLPLDPDPVRVRVRAEKLIDTVHGVIAGGGLPDELRVLRDAGVVVIRVPSLVSLDAVVATPRRFHGDAGEIAVLDADLDLLAGPIPLGTLPEVPGYTAGGTVPSHVVRRFTFADPMPPFAATDPPVARWLVLRPPAAPVVAGQGQEDASFLLELCGILLTAWREAARAHQDVLNTISQLTTLSGLVAGEPALLNQPLLVPGEQYELVGSIDWARFRSRDAADPDGISHDEGGPFPVRSRRFVADPSSPRDLTRHVRDHDPFDEDQPHFTGEPLLLRYASAAVDRIYAAYGEQLVIRAKSDAAGHVLVQPTSASAGTTFAPMGPVEQELLTSLEAISDACLPGVWLHLFPRTLHTVREPLLPNNAYTVSLLARPQSEPGPLTGPAWEQMLEEAFEAGEFVYRFDLRTSRWTDFADQLASYDAAAVGDLFVDDPVALAVAVLGLPAGSVLRSDAVADELSRSVAGGPMIIPAEPEVMRLWVPDGAGWSCAGLLLDGPEPLLRRRLRDDGAVEERLTLDARSTSSPAVPFALGSPLAGLRLAAGDRGARVFVLFEPTVLGADGAVAVRFHDRGASTLNGPGSDRDLSVAVGVVPPALVEVLG